MTMAYLEATGSSFQSVLMEVLASHRRRGSELAGCHAFVGPVKDSNPKGYHRESMWTPTRQHAFAVIFPLTLCGKEPRKHGTRRLIGRRSTDSESLMSNPGTLLYCGEAIRFIELIEDPVTKSFVNMAFVHLVKRVHLEKRDRPRCDLDMLFLVTSLKDIFAEHDVLAQTLQGEKVGAWFEDEA